LFGRIWQGWRRGVAVVGAFQSRVLLSLFYWVVLTPYALLTRYLGDPLRLRRPKEATNWVPWQARTEDLTEAQRQH